MIYKKVNSLKLDDPSYPEILRHIAQPPKQLFYLGSDPTEWLDRPKVAIVGSRKMSPYGKQVTERLSAALARRGIVVISGLALGVDATAHQAALEAEGLTVAVLPTSLNTIYPASHRELAERIVNAGGTLISEYQSESDTQIANFVARNRIVSGLADVLLITEAAVNSGSLHTAKFALEQGKTVMAVPGNINSPCSEGCNNLIKGGAVPVTCSEDVFFTLGIKPSKSQSARSFRGNETEQKILELISAGVYRQEDLALATNFDSAAVNSALTMLEIAGHIRPQGAGIWTLA
jgi:DNA processing protein